MGFFSWLKSKFKRKRSSTPPRQQPRPAQSQNHQAPQPVSPELAEETLPDESSSPPPEKASSYSSGESHAFVKKTPSPLNIYLDEDRDGNVDEKPASCDSWSWGKPELGEEGKVVRGGTVILVHASRVYDENQEVMERTPLVIKWDSEEPFPEKWEAELKVNPADKIRIYLEREHGAELLLGGSPEKSSLKLQDGETIHDTLEWEDSKSITLWMEAVDYPISAYKDHWLVTLELKYKQRIQTAKVCIAPWIMASDLDKTKKLYIIDFKNGKFKEQNRVKNGTILIDNSTVIEDVCNKVDGCVVEKITTGLSTKNRYLRDAMRFGIQSAPGIEEENRAMSVVLRSNSNAAQVGIPKGGIKRKDDKVGYLEKGGKPHGTDLQTGGNMMVSPTIKGYPWGRIICGSVGKGGLGGWETFLNGQCIQKPIKIDTSWLSVGHSDEIVAFVPVVNGAKASPGKNFRMVIASPRQAYKLLYDAKINWELVGNELKQRFVEDKIYQKKWEKKIESEVKKYDPVAKSDFKDETLVERLLAAKIIEATKEDSKYVIFCGRKIDPDKNVDSFTRKLKGKGFGEKEIEDKIKPVWRKYLLNYVDFRKMMDRGELSRGDDKGEYRIAFNRFDNDLKTSQKWLSDFFAHDELLSRNVVWPELVQKLHANSLMEISKEDDKRLNEELSELEQELAPSEPEPEPELDGGKGIPPPPPSAVDPEIAKKKCRKKKEEIKKNKEIQLAIDSLWEKGYGGLIPKQRDILKPWIKKNILKLEKEVELNNIASPDKQKAARWLGHCYLAEFPEFKDFTVAWFLFEAVKEDYALLDFMPKLLSELVKKSQDLWKSVFSADGLELAKAKDEAKHNPGSPTMMELYAKIGELLKIPPEEWGNIGKSFQKINMIVQAKLDVTREVLKDELKLQDSDIIEVPILYTNIDEAKTVVGDMVNFVLLNQPADPPKPGDESPKPSSGCQCIVPKPCGPIIGGRDIFEEEMKTHLERLGIKVEFIDEWYEYHLNDGEIHCGTNQLPEVVPKKWWEQKPAPWQ